MAKKRDRDPEKKTRVSKKAVETLINDKVYELMLDMDERTASSTDKSMIRSMAVLAITSESIQERMINETDPTAIKNLVGAMKQSDSEYRQMAKALRLDRTSRQSRAESEVDKYLPLLYKRALAFMDKHSIMIMCPDCMMEPPVVKILQAHIVFHFAATELPFRWESSCPRDSTHRPVVITNDNWRLYTAEALKAKEILIREEHAEADDET